MYLPFSVPLGKGVSRKVMEFEGLPKKKPDAEPAPGHVT